MVKKIKLGKQDVDSIYKGRFLIVTNAEKGVCSIFDIQKERHISLPTLDNQYEWQVEKVTDNAIVFCSILHPEYQKKFVKCTFLTSTGNFLKHPENNFSVLLCKSVEITDKTIYCDCPATEAQYYFNTFGEIIATVEENEKISYTVKLGYTEVIENASEVQQIKNIESQEIMGLYIIAKGKNSNIFYKF